VSVALSSAAIPRGLAGRLLPLQIAVGLQGVLLWVPVEKLFMTEIGFDARSVAIMAAAYAAVVPLLEVPSGILADRWSRSYVMVCASIALIASSLLGGLSANVATYVVAAMLLGAYFALNSGTVDSIVYDVVLEETGSSDVYETWIGRSGWSRAARSWRALSRAASSPASRRRGSRLRVGAVRGSGDRGVPALRRAAPAPLRRPRRAAQPRRSHVFGR
jgi:MFS family permease